MRRLSHLVVALTILSASPALWADDLTGEDKILCTAVQATACFADGECTSAPPWTLNIPQFIEIHLDEKLLRTTAASGENRASPIRHLERADGMIFLQGVENGRAFSFVITESTGRASIAVATEDKGVSVFGACTVIPSSR